MGSHQPSTMQAELHPIEAPPHVSTARELYNEERSKHDGDMQDHSAWIEGKIRNRDIFYSREGPLDHKNWRYYDTRTRLHKTTYGVPEQPAYAGATTQPWQRGLEQETVRMLRDTSRAAGIELQHAYMEFTNGSQFMLASQFYLFAWRCMLIEDSNDLDNFFKMALNRPYSASFTFGFDRFVSALARICDNISFTQEVPLPETIQIIVDKHLSCIRLDVLKPLIKHEPPLAWRAPLQRPANEGLYRNQFMQ